MLSHMHMQWYKAWKVLLQEYDILVPDRHVVGFHGELHGGWLCIKTHGHTGILIKCQVDEHTQTFQIVKPFILSTTLDVFGDRLVLIDSKELCMWCRRGGECGVWLTLTAPKPKRSQRAPKLGVVLADLGVLDAFAVVT